jgi:hypothetical protein
VSSAGEEKSSASEGNRLYSSNKVKKGELHASVLHTIHTIYIYHCKYI